MSGIFDDRHGKVGTRLGKTESRIREMFVIRSSQMEVAYGSPAGAWLEYPDVRLHAVNRLQKGFCRIGSNAPMGDWADECAIE